MEPNRGKVCGFLSVWRFPIISIWPSDWLDDPSCFTLSASRLTHSYSQAKWSLLMLHVTAAEKKEREGQRKSTSHLVSTAASGA